jgi:hypothetical protein
LVDEILECYRNACERSGILAFRYDHVDCGSPGQGTVSIDECERIDRTLRTIRYSERLPDNIRSLQTAGSDL